MASHKRKRFKRSGNFFVYIVQCADGNYYTGYTLDIKQRIRLHNNGKGAKYTRDRKPVRLVWCKEYKYFKNAFLEEKRIKGLRRQQKEKLINEFNSNAVSYLNRIWRRERHNNETMVRVTI
ncbi:GIY-YIG nuclease family protein [Candidatus Omnitrophota bacterium]